MPETSLQIMIDTTLKRAIDIHIAAKGLNKKEFVIDALMEKVDKKYIEEAQATINNEN